MAELKIAPNILAELELPSPRKRHKFRGNPEIRKCPTGITGLDEITEGGLPKGRPTLLVGNAGCGKTLLAMEFLVHGARDYNEPGVFMSFEEKTKDLKLNFASLGFNLKVLESEKKILLDYVHLEKSEMVVKGNFELEGLFVRLNLAIDSIGAKRVVLDTIEVLFSDLNNDRILRSELERLFHWLKDKGVTAIVTGELGEKSLTRYGLEEYVADCVIILDNRVFNQISTRRLRIIKYRGSSHGTNEYPFMITHEGISVLPITSLKLDSNVSNARVSTGVKTLDKMFGGKGYFRGSDILISGTSGSGKTTLLSHFVDASCRRGERVVYLSFEESPKQLVRNMNAVGMNLEQWTKKGLLHIIASRPTFFGLEAHPAMIRKLVEVYKPNCLVMDPISNLMPSGDFLEVKGMLTKVVDFLKKNNITTVISNLDYSQGIMEENDVGISSLMDTVVLLRFNVEDSKRKRMLYIQKSRGMTHSTDIKEYTITSKGLCLV